jgi:hypothetical protein
MHAAWTKAAGRTREARMMHQAVTDATPAQATLAASEPADQDRADDGAVVAEELLVGRRPGTGPSPAA